MILVYEPFTRTNSGGTFVRVRANHNWGEPVVTLARVRSVRTIGPDDVLETFTLEGRQYLYGPTRVLVYATADEHAEDVPRDFSGWMELP